jgi:predicted nucleic acid-binding protein
MVAAVLDASLVLAWVLDEALPLGFEKLQDLIYTEGARVPALWPVEVANGLLAATKQRRLPAHEVPGILADLAHLPLEVDNLTAHYAWTRTYQLAIRHQLTLYDATFLEVALRFGLPLATLDRALQRAARAEHLLVYAGTLDEGSMPVE